MGKALDESELKQRDGIDQWIRSQTPIQGTYIRGIPNTSPNAFGKARPGDVVSDKGFMSITDKAGIAVTFATSGFAAGYDKEPATLVFIRGKAIKIPNEAQGEYLVPRNTRYKVTETKLLEARFSYNRKTGEYKRNRNGMIKAKYKAVYVDIIDERSDAAASSNKKSFGTSPNL